MTSRTLDATDPQSLNAAASAVLAEAAQSAVQNVEIDRSSEVLPETSVTLVAGYLAGPDEVITDAEIRELTGADEEIIAKASASGRILQTVLERGMVSVGTERADKSLLDSLLMGDREQCLLAIRIATFGDTVEVEVPCPGCSTVQVVEIDLTKDVPMRRLDRPMDRFFSVDGRAGTFSVTLPDGKVHRDLLSSADKTTSELNTLLLGGCVTAVNGQPVLNKDTVLRMSIRDRTKITQQIADRNPGPRLADIKKPCPACSEDLALPLTFADLFRL